MSLTSRSNDKLYVPFSNLGMLVLLPPTPQANGTALPSFTAELIESNPNPTAEEELTYKWASATFYAGVFSLSYLEQEISTKASYA